MLEAKLTGYTRLQKMHTLLRLIEKLRLIHNAVGDASVLRQVITIAQFAASYPEVYARLKTELAPYVVGNYLSETGFRYFQDHIFDPRENACFRVLNPVKIELRNITADFELNPFVEYENLPAKFTVQ